jgi:hypothetical protein
MEVVIGFFIIVVVEEVDSLKSFGITRDKKDDEIRDFL